MKTKEKYNGNNIDLGEKSFYIEKLNNFNDYNPNLDQERIISRYKKSDIKFYYDNSVISQSYGQYNVEKCLIIILSIFLFSCVLGYEYYESFSQTKLYWLIGSSSIDFFIACYYIYFLYKLKKEEVFQKVSLSSFSILDFFIFVNFLSKIFFTLSIFTDNSFYFLWCLISFLAKSLLDLYFVMISLKLFMLSPCMIKVLEFMERLWVNIKYYILCCEVEEPDHPDYTKLEELESFY